MLVEEPREVSGCWWRVPRGGSGCWWRVPREVSGCWWRGFRVLVEGS